MTRSLLTCLAALLLLAAPAPADDAKLPPPATGKVDFEKQIRPLLQSKCFDCHGEDVQESQLRLDRKASLIRGGDSGEPAIVPGNSAGSHLIRLVAGLEADLVMPPGDDDRLSHAEIGLLRAWIDQNAPWPGPDGVVTQTKLETDHWSFQPVKDVPVPETDSPWVRNGIDAFIFRKLNEQGLTPSEPADRRTLVRRLYLDVLGLPPTPVQVARFVNDQRPDAYELLVDDLLASPHFGERWARYWLDLVRFAETHGFETNRERPNAWPYRDYVIQSFNDDKPYDRFIREQIAGDALGVPVATGFLVAGPYDLVKSPDLSLTLMQRQNELDDMINTTGTAFLGLTLGCARCHNHKFDPVTQTDYYSLQAVFAGIQHGDRTLPLPAERREQLAQLDTRIADLTRRLAPFQVRAAATRFLLVDDDPTRAAGRVQHLRTPAGRGTNPAGREPGQRDDPGSDTRSPNVSGGSYTWWKNAPGEPLIAYRPVLTGDCRIWLSWGCGYGTHSPDVRYVLDRDGDPATTDDQEELATVDQQRFADGTGDVPGQALWSGFRSAGIQRLDADDAVLLIGGGSGTAVTADAVVFETIDDPATAATQPRLPAFRPPVSPLHNIEHIQPVTARFVRFTVRGTNSSQPCLDELEIFSGDTNVALASAGARATCSSALPGYEIHKLEHIHDGRYGNGRSWISNEPGAGWVQIEFPQPARIDRIEWARDREGKFGDRLATDYIIEAALEPDDWQTIAGSADRLPYDADNAAPAAPQYRFDAATPDEAREARSWLTELEAARRTRESLAQAPTVYAGTFEQPGPTHRLYRGDPMAAREAVSPNTVASIGTLELTAESPEQERRRALADWIASRDNPLTARVIVNRLWQFHFGRGLVDTPSDFGAGGVPPTHPELLDWLARQLTDNNWSLKHIHRLMLLSATYRQSSSPRPEPLRADGGTQFWWRFPPRRLEAEPMRDSILAVTGVLDLRMAGPGFSAFEVEAENVRHYHPKSEYGPDDWRRMIYMTKVRQEQDSVFGVFDCPDASTSVPKRSRSTTPLQALNLFNSTFVLQQAELFADRLERDAGEDSARQVDLAFRLCFARNPAAEERDDARQFIERQGLPAFCRALLNSNEFLFIE